MQASERVVVIKGDASKWYSQAVFFVNPQSPPAKVPKDFVTEAENIIHNYMEKRQKNMGGSVPAYMDYYTPHTVLPPPAGKKRRIRHSFILYALMIAACVAMAVVFALFAPFS